MKISVQNVTVDTFAHQLGCLSALLEKGLAHATARKFDIEPAEGIDRHPIALVDDDRCRFRLDDRNAFEALARRKGFERIERDLAPFAEERLHRKQRLASAFRLFAKFGFSEGVAGHITVRDPERLDHFWVNPFGMHFGHIRVSDLVLVDEKGEVVEGDGGRLGQVAEVLVV